MVLYRNIFETLVAAGEDEHLESDKASNTLRLLVAAAHASVDYAERNIYACPRLEQRTARLAIRLTCPGALFRHRGNSAGARGTRDRTMEWVIQIPFPTPSINFAEQYCPEIGRDSRVHMCVNPQYQRHNTLQRSRVGAESVFPACNEASVHSNQPRALIKLRCACIGSWRSRRRSR